MKKKRIAFLLALLLLLVPAGCAAGETAAREQKPAAETPRQGSEQPEAPAEPEPEPEPSHTHVWAAKHYDFHDCAEGEYDEYTCECGESYREYTVPPAPHVGEWAAAQPTCEEDGYELEYCTVCGMLRDGRTVIPALGHDLQDTAVEPTCTEDGFIGAVCSRCGYSEIYEVIPATGHSWETATVRPGCTEKGYTCDTCSVCGEISGTRDITPALGHDLKQIIEPNSCTKDGFTVMRCSRCGYEENKTDLVPATGHNWETRTAEATCTEAGYTAQVCLNCGEVKEQTDRVEPLGHDYVETVVEATGDAGGYTLHKCSRCGDEYRDNETERLPVDLNQIMAAGNATLASLGFKVDYSMTPSNSGYYPPSQRSLDMTQSRLNAYGREEAMATYEYLLYWDGTIEGARGRIYVEVHGNDLWIYGLYG